MADTFTKTLGLNVTGSVDPQLGATIKRLHDLAFRNQKQVLKMMERVEKNQRRQKQHIDAINRSNTKRKSTETVIASKIKEQTRSYKALAAEARKNRKEVERTRQAASRKQGGIMGAGIGGMVGMAGFGGKIGAGIGAAAAHPAVLAAGLVAQKVGEVGNKLKNFVLVGAFMFLRVTRMLTRAWGQIVSMIAGAGEKLLSLTSNLLKTSASMEDMRSRMGAIFGDQAEGMFDFITEKAKIVPFQIDEMMASFIKLKASGASALVPIERSFAAASDLAVTFNRSLEDSTAALTQLMAGRADRFIRSFNIRPDQLVPFGASVRPGTGGLEADTEEQKKANLEAALSFVEDRFGGMTESMADNFNQLLNNMGDKWLKFADRLRATGLTKVGASFLKTIELLFEKLEKGPELQAWADMLTLAASKLVRAGTALLEYSPALITQAVEVLTGLVDKLLILIAENGGIEGLANKASILIEFGDKVADAVKGVLPIVLEILPGLLRIFGGLTKIVADIWGKIVKVFGFLTLEPDASPVQKGSAVAGGGVLGALAGIPGGPIGVLAGAVGGAGGIAGGQIVRDASGISQGGLNKLEGGLDKLGTKLADAADDAAAAALAFEQSSGSVSKIDGLTDFQRQWLAAGSTKSGGGGGDQFFAGTAGGMGAVPGRSLAGGIGGVAGGVAADGPSAYGNAIRSASADGAAMMGGAITNALGGMGKAASTTSAAGSKGRSLSEFVSNVETVMSAMPVETALRNRSAGSMPTDNRTDSEVMKNAWRNILSAPGRSFKREFPKSDVASIGAGAGRFLRGEDPFAEPPSQVQLEARGVRAFYGSGSRSSASSSQQIINVDVSGNGDLGMAMGYAGIAAKEIGNHAK